tara:strand:+ start:389 stop:970 length:582 start_codon:yes stop_codon:yes gene_type:complete
MQNNITDEQLIKNFQNGDEKSYTILVNKYRDRIKNFICGFLKDEVVAEDLTQDTMFKFYQKKDSYKEIAKFSTWLYTIAGNLAKTELRKLSRRKTGSFSDLEERTGKPIDIEDTSNQNLDSEEGSSYLYDAIMELDIEFRTIIILRNSQELSYESISKILKIPLGTVKSRINRGKLKLVDILRRKGVSKKYVK